MFCISDIISAAFILHILNTSMCLEGKHILRYQLSVLEKDCSILGLFLQYVFK